MLALKKILGMAPKEEASGAFSPSPIALKLATKNKTDYDHKTYSDVYKGGHHKVMVVCTEKSDLEMKNGKRFATGNHPVELLVPMLHLRQAGFEIDIFTLSGAPVQLEMWAMPDKDKAVKELYQQYKTQFDQPASLKDFVDNKMDEQSPYLAVFIPGGHGAILDLPDSTVLGQLLHWAHDSDKYILSICHGPAALLAAQNDQEFLFKDYKMAVFPDSLDKLTPLFGYLPGKMPWYFGEKLKQLGVKIINSKANGTCCHDRKLITGDSPDAANKFGSMAAQALLLLVAERSAQ